MASNKIHDRNKVTYDADEAADMLKIHRKSVLELAERGELPGAKIGRAWVFVVDDLVEWLRNQTDLQRRQRIESKLEPRVGGGRRREPPKLPDIPEAS